MWCCCDEDGGNIGDCGSEDGGNSGDGRRSHNGGDGGGGGNGDGDCNSGTLNSVMVRVAAMLVAVLEYELMTANAVTANLAVHGSMKSCPIYLD